MTINFIHENQGLIIYILFGLLTLLLVINFPIQVKKIINWSVFQLQKTSKENKKMSQSQINEESAKEIPNFAFFYLFLIMTFWPSILILPIIAFFIFIFHTEN